MKFTAASAPAAYDPQDQSNFRRSLENWLVRVLLGGQDCEIGQGRLILTDTVTGDRYSITMADGVLTETLL